MNLSFQYVEKKVKKSILTKVLAEMKKLINDENTNLWGEIKPRTFHYVNLVLSLYHDLTGLGYRKILEDVHLPFHLSYSSFCHNVCEIRKVLAKWGRQQIVLGDLPTWKRAARHSAFPEKTQDACMLIDSSDFQIKGRRSISRKSAWWSYKLNAPGRRFTFLIDCRRRILKIWGGYSPKVHDGEFITVQQEFFEEKLNGAAILGDQHYSKGKGFEGVTFYVPFKSPKKISEDDQDVTGYEKLSKEKEHWNKMVR